LGSVPKRLDSKGEKMTEEVTIKESGYDQKAYIQLRLHELILRYDRANINPLAYNFELGCSNYNVMYQSLLSIYNTISSKLKSAERENGIKQLNKLTTKMKSNIYLNRNGRKVLVEENYYSLITCMFETRNLFEEYMDSHGFNPSKDDVGKSIVKM
jgi:hypothetical protein